MARSAVPPPMSSSATPSSFSSGVSTASAAASWPITVSTTSRPARFTQATRFWVEVEAPVTMWTLTSSRAPVIPTGAPMPSCSSTTKSCGSTCSTSRPAGSDTARAASMRAADVLAGDLAVLAGHGDDAAAVEALDVRAAHRQVRRADLDAGHQLGLLDRLLDRIDGGFEVDDDAALQALRLGQADADHVEPAALGRPRRRPCRPSRCRCRGRRCTARFAPLLPSRPSAAAPATRAPARSSPPIGRTYIRSPNRRSTVSIAATRSLSAEATSR